MESLPSQHLQNEDLVDQIRARLDGQHAAEVAHPQQGYDGGQCEGGRLGKPKAVFVALLCKTHRSTRRCFDAVNDLESILQRELL